MNQQKKDLFINNLPRLKWACRRGMLELDVILNNFLNDAYANLSVEEKQAFVKLLEQSDPELFNWLLGYETPNEEHAHIVAIIRHYAHSKI